MELRGFKSFADKTVVEFKNGIACIVGPNGSGKSNITDAISWVLGEQSVKSLRGKKMEDVIFNGTKHRQSLGMAEVTLVFDNSSQFFPLDYEEVSVTRRVFRSGESEYKMNNLPCRLKDIKELFMDTGIGTDGYSIIRQGKVEEILSTNKDDRRMLFEEAAGIVKFKTRKKETMRKLNKTNDNLIRLEDIMSEIGGRVEPLRKASEKATSYLSLSERLKAIEVNHFIGRYDKLKVRLDEVLKEHDAIKIREEEIVKEINNLQASHQQESTSLNEAQIAHKQMEESFHEATNRLTLVQGELGLIVERLTHVEEGIMRLEQENRNFLTEQTEYDEKIADLMQKNQGVNDRLSDQKNDIALNQERLEKSQEELRVMEADNEGHRNQIINNLSDIEVSRGKVATLETMQTDLEVRIARIKDEVENYASRRGECEDSVAALNDTIKAMTTKKNSANNRMAEIIATLKEERSSRSDLIKESETRSKELSKLEGEYQLLVELEKSHDGFDRSVVNTMKLLDRKHSLKRGIHGVVGELMTVEKRYETAIEIALGKSVQHFVCDEVATAKKVIDELKREKLGRVSFLPLDNIKRKGDQQRELERAKEVRGYIGKANELVAYSGEYNTLFDYLLGRIIVVEDFEAGNEIVRIKNFKYKIITLEGDVLIPGGTITGGSHQKRLSNVFSRKRRIEELRENLGVLEDVMDDIKEELKTSMATIQSCEKEQVMVSEERDRLQTALMELQSQRDQHVNELENIEQFALKHQQDIDVLSGEHAKFNVERDDLQKTISELVVTNEELEAQMRYSGLDVTKIKSSIEEYGSQGTQMKIELNNIERELEYNQLEIQRFEGQRGILASAIKGKQSEVDEWTSRREKLHRERHLIQDQMAGLEEKINNLNHELEQQVVVQESLASKSAGYLQSLNALGRERGEIKDKFHDLDIKQTRYTTEQESVVRELWDKYELALQEAYALKTEEVGTQAEIKRIKVQIRNLGEVSISAIEEYREVKERYEFLVQQEEDLVEAKKVLLKIIRDLDKQMHAMFIEKFNEISINFKEIYGQLFHGGYAEISLADSEDVLESDIVIEAQPPGKKLQSIELLSGGEKSLTAIALLFAILRTKPTPFCVLDEIEAALDDVNVYRFADFLKVFTDKSQFVVITHRKGTMESADLIYGVTMEEYGVSKIISVKLEDA